MHDSRIVFRYIMISSVYIRVRYVLAMRSKSRDRSWSRLESTCLIGVGVGAGESVKFYRIRLQPGVAGLHPVTNDDLGRTVMHPPET